MGFFLKETDFHKVELLLCKGRAFNSYNEALQLVRGKIKMRYVISFLNMHAIQQAVRNERFFQSLLESDLLLFDGIAVKILCKFFRIGYGINMNGSDFLPVLISRFSEKRYDIFASHDPALNMFRTKHPNLRIGSMLNGFCHFDKYLTATKEHKSDIILLGMGMPKQEILSSMIRSDTIIINGGAIIDYMSGFKSRCPAIFTRCNIEWLYRMFYEPKRLFKRYTKGFILLIKIISSNSLYEKKTGKAISTEVSISFTKKRTSTRKNKIKPSKQGIS